jgi:hypothetical protein
MLLETIFRAYLDFGPKVENITTNNNRGLSTNSSSISRNVKIVSVGCHNQSSNDGVSILCVNNSNDLSFYLSKKN